ncbi:MAG: MBL fold metallo-hydrolase [Deltaproteobacteria bacterium]|nr:MBL fold metallo-hydrolase [Deltaproteobacteria bacterium]
MRLIVLGCGTSTGVPVIGCRCGVCASPNPGNKRTRASILVQTQGKNILTDTSTDLRAQALSNGIERIDYVLYTHPHADHVHGIDDLRSFNMAQGGASIPCYGNSYTMERLESMFPYIFREKGAEHWRPNLSTNAVDSAFSLSGIEVVPIEILHGDASILGYRIDGAAYITDISAIPPESMEKLKGLDVLIIGALRKEPHPTHLSIPQAIEISEKLRPKRTILTHLGHSIDYEKDGAMLPTGVELAYDGMVIELKGGK